jgi:glucose-6-phosphate dehydrogenase assembly protein OpcA
VSDQAASPTHTDLAGVDRELARLRGGGHGTNVRATTLNLVAFAASDDHVNRISDAITTIGSSRPLRALVAVPGSGGLRATVSCSTWLGAGGQEVCTELVLIEAAAAALPSALLGLLIPDLPVFLLWQGEIGEHRRLLEQLAAQATRLLLDSDECGLEATASVSGLTPALTDLAWTRLIPWREALAGFADASAGLRDLRRATAVAARGPENEAGLMAGWLRSRLQLHLGLDRSGRGQNMERVAIQSSAGEFVVERVGRGAVGRALGPDGIEHPVMLPHRDWAQLVGAELDRMGSDRVYEAALAAA